LRQIDDRRCRQAVAVRADTDSRLWRMTIAFHCLVTAGPGLTDYLACGFALEAQHPTHRGNSGAIVFTFALPNEVWPVGQIDDHPE
jgi:hypothetical protein